MSRAQRLFLASALLTWLAVASPGQEPAAPPATPPATRPAPPPAEAERESPAPETPPGNTDGASEDEFIPTEELPPDSAINFPVDI
ncbi:MAG TPA: hypothetical protein VKA43_12355 [Gammaproteobacteria bacterium]|nr:hypothetical protein [Gammaproteobacteria bacterium]